MQYLINTNNNDVVCALDTDVPLSTTPDSIIVREGDFGYDVEKLVYDPETDTIIALSDEEYLVKVKEAKLNDLKTQVMISFGNLGDAIADAVKAIKLIMKWIVEEDAGTKRDLEDYFKALLPKFEVIYPDNYAKACAAKYADSLVVGLATYYQKKLEVLSATTPEDVEKINL